MAAGEEELLAWYLRDIDETGEHDFILPEDADTVVIPEGMWDEFIHSTQRQAQIEANRVSYAWDALIETFNHHILAGTQYYSNHSDFRDLDLIMRFLARENRTRRRMLARTLLEIIQTTPKTLRRTCVVQPSRPGDPYYVFLLLPHPEWVPYDQYRAVRREFLSACCMVTKLMYPDAQDIVAIATETGADNEGRSEDAFYFDAHNWSDEQQSEAKRLQQELGLLTNVKKHQGVEQEYPHMRQVPQPTNNSRQKPKMKGRDRNAPCPYGSGKKFKRCCG